MLQLDLHPPGERRYSRHAHRQLQRRPKRRQMQNYACNGPRGNHLLIRALGLRHNPTLTPGDPAGALPPGIPLQDPTESPKEPCPSRETRLESRCANSFRQTDIHRHTHPPAKYAVPVGA